MRCGVQAQVQAQVVVSCCYCKRLHGYHTRNSGLQAAPPHPKGTRAAVAVK